jgi:Aminoglycoside-2''-adenylyltransferase
LTDAALDAIYGRWCGRSDLDAADLMAGLAFPWWIVGGWAIEAFTGVRRHHRDVDIAFHTADLEAFRLQVQDEWHVWANTSGSLLYLEPGQHLPATCDQLWLRRNADESWEYDIVLHSGSMDEWVSRRDPDWSMKLDDATWIASNGIRYQNPELTLLFKAHHTKSHDHIDFQSTWPRLRTSQRAWLVDRLRVTQPHHPWLTYSG